MPLNTNDSIYSNLYIDESGYSYLGQSHYRFFLLTALIISPNQRILANLLMDEWRKKYMIHDKKCFHAYDFFEDSTGKYTQPKTRIPRVYQKAVNDLIEILGHIKFSAEVFYVDIKGLRKKLLVSDPPLDPGDKKEYLRLKKIYAKGLIQSFGNKVQLPLTLTFKSSLEFHSRIMKGVALQDNYHRTPKGYINIESRNESDSDLIKIFHKYGQTIYDKIGEDVVGLNLHTKGSLDSGIELADFISYVSFQTLRIKHRLSNELKDISPLHLQILKITRKNLRNKFSVKITNVTDRDI